jgi:transcription initiation factor IIE alpha subunit
MDLKKYELDCALTADGQCSKCNETLFQSIYSMMEKHFGKIEDWHNSEKG